MGSLNNAIGQTQANSINKIGEINSNVAANQQNPWTGAISGAMSGAMAGSAAGPWGALAGGVAGGAMGYVNSKNGGNAQQGQQATNNTIGDFSSLMNMFGGSQGQSNGSSLYARAS